MKRMASALLAGFTIALAGCSSSNSGGGANHADKIIGQWQVTKIYGKELPKDASIVFEFSKDGKIMSTETSDGKDEIEEGTYKVEGDKITYTKTGFKDEGTFHIKTLTDDTLILVEGKDREMEMKKK